jgi:hypothetical protein
MTAVRRQVEPIRDAMTAAAIGIATNAVTEAYRWT